MVKDALAGEVESFVFAVPSGARWALPLYELALLTRARLVDAGAIGVRVTVVTPEDAARALRPAGERGDRRAARGPRHRARSRDGPARVRRRRPVGRARRLGRGRPRGGAATARGHAARRLPSDSRASSRPTRSDRSTARSTSGPPETRPLPTQAGRDRCPAGRRRSRVDRGPRRRELEPSPFRAGAARAAVDRDGPRFLRAEGSPAASQVDTEPLWWPPAKIVGRYLAPFLARRLGLSELLPDAARESAVAVEIELDPAEHGVWSKV